MEHDGPLNRPRPILCISYAARVQALSHSYGLIGTSSTSESRRPSWPRLSLATRAERYGFGNNSARRCFACREWLDAFVSDRMRHAVAEVENVGHDDAVRDDKQDL
jgi:hypothetical protein